MRPAPSTPVQTTPLPPPRPPRGHRAADGAHPGPGRAVRNLQRHRRRAAAAEKPPPASQRPQPRRPPRDVVVGRTETLFDVAERTCAPVRTLIEANNLKPPYDLAPGTRLRVPQAQVYTVKSGDTLFGIARRFSIDPRSLANLNDFPLETGIKPGQKIALPAQARDNGPVAGASSEAPPAPPVVFAQAPARSPAASSSAIGSSARSPAGAPPAAAAPAPYAVASAAAPPARTPSGLPPIGSKPAATPLPQPPAAQLATAAPSEDAPAAAEDAPPQDSQVAAAGRGRFVWPVRGELISRLRPQGARPAQRRPEHRRQPGRSRSRPPRRARWPSPATCRASATSVLVKHPGGWVTAYAHLSKLEVKIKDRVIQGRSWARRARPARSTGRSCISRSATPPRRARRPARSIRACCCQAEP